MVISSNLSGNVLYGKLQVLRISIRQVAQPLFQGFHQNLRVPLLFSFRGGKLEGEDALVVRGHIRNHTDNALQGIHAGASEDGNRGADDIAARVGPAAVPFNEAPGVALLPAIQDSGDPESARSPRCSSASRLR